MQFIVMPAMVPPYFIILFIFFFLCLIKSYRFIFFQPLTVNFNPFFESHVTELIDALAICGAIVWLMFLHIEVILSESIEPSYQVILLGILLLVLGYEVNEGLLSLRV
jgi:hypothetical protein